MNKSRIPIALKNGRLDKLHQHSLRSGHQAVAGQNKGANIRKKSAVNKMPLFFVDAMRLMTVNSQLRTTTTAANSTKTHKTLVALEIRTHIARSTPDT